MDDKNYSLPLCAYVAGFGKAMTSHKYFAENLLSRTAPWPFIGLPQTILHQLLNHHSQQYIQYRCKNNLLYCCSLCLCNKAISFLHEAIVHKPVFHSTFMQRTAIRVCMHTHGHQAMVTEISNTTNFRAHFFYKTFLCWLATVAQPA